MMDYKAHLDKFISDLYKRIDEEDEQRKSLKIINNNYEIILKQLTQLTEAFNKSKTELSIQFIDNAQFVNLMGISQKTAQTWRDTGVVSFSQIGNKIYYRTSDIQELLEKNYRKSTQL